ncbi:MAG: efflux RND transporter periplasmic adaptor subunit [Calditrichia bacterium]
MKKRFYLAAVGLALTGALALLSQCGKKEAAEKYLTVPIQQRNIEQTVSCTGILEPVSQVEVGTQVSGRIDRVLVDFNDEIRKGQILAILDTIPLKADLLSAEAEVERNEALLKKAEDDYRRNLELFEQQLISRAEFLPFETNWRTQQASLKAARAKLIRAQKNLEYALITSPISGKVISRNVEAGQTVAASFNTPTLFIIAENLSKMEIHATVDESDIGLIKQGLPVRFEVPAYPERQFEGVVQQIRLQPETIQNVVNYTVVIEADNPEGLLLPGMTATVDFLLENRQNVLAVPNSALRFSPSEEELEAFREEMMKRRRARADSSARSNRQFTGKENGGSPDGLKRVWILGENNRLRPAAFLAGATDGQYTEILRSRVLSEGVRVVTGRATGTSKNKNNNQQPPFGPRRPF